MSSTHLTTLFLLISVIGVLAHSMIDYNLQFVGIALPFWMCLAFLASITMEETVNTSSFFHWRCSRTFTQLKLVLALLLMLTAITEGYLLCTSSIARHYEAQGNTDAALSWYKKAQHEWFSRDMYLSEAQLFMQKDDLPAAQDALDLYMTENAQDARAWKIQSIVAEKQKDTLLAQQSVDTAYAYGKYTDLQNFALLLTSGKDAKRLTELRARKQEFDQLFSDYADALLHNTHFIDLSLAPEEILEVSRNLSALYPTDSVRYHKIARDAFNHATDERLLQKARPRGILW